MKPTAGATIHTESFVIMPRPMHSAMHSILFIERDLYQYSVFSTAPSMNVMESISLLMLPDII